MKVVFKLNRAQQETAAGLVTPSPVKNQEGKWVFCGNVGGWVEDTGYGVSRQFLVLEGGLLSFEGRRTALIDGEASSLKKIAEIFGGIETATAAIVSYETTDKRLAWHESLEMAIDKKRLTADELFDVVAKTPGRSCAYAAEYELIQMAGGLDVIYAAIQHPRRAAAQFNGEELKLKRRVGKLIGVTMTDE